MENNEWKPVLGYEGLYEVNSNGDIRSISYKRKGKAIILKTEISSKYKRLTLCKNKVRKNRFVHIIVWEAFNGPVPAGMQVNHINEDKLDNRIENLNLLTPKENINWGTANKRRGEKREIPVNQYTISGEYIKQHTSAQSIENELGYAQQNICRCCKGKRKTAYGFVWRYAV